MASDLDFQPSYASCAVTCPDWLAQLEQAFATIDDSHFFSANRDADDFQKFSATLKEKRVAYERIVGASTEDAIGWMVSGLQNHPLAEVHAVTKLGEVQSMDALRQRIQRVAKLTSNCGDEQSFAHQQWLHVELPLTLRYFLAEMPETEPLVELAIETMVTQFEQLLDTDGWPGATTLPDFGPLSASWFRCMCMIDGLGETFSGHLVDQRDADEAIREAVAGLHRQLLRLMRKNRTLMMSHHKCAVPPTMVAAMVEKWGGPDDWAILERTGKRPVKPRPNLVALDRSRNSVSQWGNSLLFHDGWERKACKLAATFDAGHCMMELSKGIPLLDGNTLPKIALDEVPLGATGEPEVLVSLCDDKIAFAEIQWPLEQGAFLQRHIMLSMEDRFALIGDAIVTQDTHRITYGCRWPLAKGISTIPESETTEGYLYDGKKIRALVIPPALPEWKAERTAGKLTFAEDHFTLQQTAEGSALHAPLFIDLDPKRSKLKRTWRQLTVAEKLEIVAADVAVAYRIQVHKKQFAFYRSLAESENRTFLGQNVNIELFLGRLEKNHTMTELLQVE